MTLSAREKAIRQRLKDDLPHYAEKCLKVRAKSGAIVPLILNRAQKHIHDRLQAQLADTGKVRALILKGRQQGCCYSPEMRILTADYRWIKIADIEIGERIIAIDEDRGPLNKAGRGRERRLRTAIVESKHKFQRKAVELELSNGVKLIVTEEHRHLCRQRGGDSVLWRTVSDTKIGDSIRAISHAPEHDMPLFEDGWFSGLLDGEGSFLAAPQIRIAISQVDGPVLRRAKKYLEDREIRYYELIDARKGGISSKLGGKAVHCLRIDRYTDVLKLMTITRPSRFVGRELFVGKKMPKTCPGFDAWARVISVKNVGVRDVIDIQTSEKTFICEGIVSHNSSYVAARYYHKTTHSRGIRTFILTHEDAATQNLFEMVNRYHEHCPALVKPATGAANAKELNFCGIDSGYKIGTAGTKGVGRSSTLQLFHGSESSFWPHAETHAAGVLQAVPNEPGTEVILESTANGIGNFFHKKWQEAERGEGDYTAIFVPWFWQDEYRREVDADFQLSDEEREYAESHDLTLEQMSWRRNKILELDDASLFKQEYPRNSIEAFQMSGHDSFISAELVAKARATRCEALGALVLGVDPSRFGKDRFSIAWRRTRRVEKIESKLKIDNVAGANWVKQIIDVDKPARVFIDVGGVGAGVVDILMSWGPPYSNIVVGINFGGEPQEPDELLEDGSKRPGPRNRRAEMWKRSRDWLKDVGGADIPDSDPLQADACGPTYHYDANQRLLIESKEHMMARGISSPDEWDAVVLTFAEPYVETPKWPRPKNRWVV